MKSDKPLEIERKFLIAMPDTAQMERDGWETYHITQIYLRDGEGGASRRVRRSVHRGEVVYIYTQKTRLTPVTCVEEECEIDLPTFERLLQERREASLPIEKVRRKLPFAGHIIEVDCYPFMQDAAILEVELKAEDEVFQIPPCIRILREVTEDKQYKNTNLAKWAYSHPGENFPLPPS